MRIKSLVKVMAVLIGVSVTSPILAQDNLSTTLIKGASIFNGTSPKLIEGKDVLVSGGKVTQIASDIETPKGAKVINAEGKVLMPGLIDVHWHTYYANLSPRILAAGDMSDVAIAGLLGAKKTLLRGFTTVRDIGGNPFAVKKVTDSGQYPGPRMFVSGPPLSQTGGHFDFRNYSDVPSNNGDVLTYWQRVGLMMVADGVPEVTKRAREILRMGATQIKISGGGGVSSTYDPLDVQQFTFEEMKAIVDVAKTWNTYVAAHIFTDESIQVAIKAGIKSIEHGNLILDKKTLKMMKKNDVWLSAQPLLDDEDALKFDNPASTQKWIDVTDGTSRNYIAAKKMGVKIAFGTDMLFDPAAAANQGKMLAKLKKWFTPFEALKMATADNAELLKMSGPRNPYPGGALGVVEKGAYADLILVDGNPLKNLDLVIDAEKNFVLIMKDGVIYKNTL